MKTLAWRMGVSLQFNSVLFPVTEVKKQFIFHLYLNPPNVLIDENFLLKAIWKSNRVEHKAMDV